MKNHNHLVSVLLTNYNYEHFVSEAIESVLNQTYSKFELIILDDGSTDNSRGMINTFSDSRIKKIFKKNEGQASAIRTGIREANGEILFLLDSDDKFYNDKIEIITNYFNEYNDVDCILHRARLFGNVDLHKKLHNVDNYWPPFPKINKIKHVHNKISIDDYGSYYTICSCIALKSKLAKLIADVNLETWGHKYYGDIYFDRPAQILGNVSLIPNILTEYRIHKNSHHLRNITVESKDNIYLKEKWLREKYKHINEVLNKCNSNELNIFRNLKWLEFAIALNYISYIDYMKNLPRTNPSIVCKILSFILTSYFQIKKLFNIKSIKN